MQGILRAMLVETGNGGARHRPCVGHMRFYGRSSTSHPSRRLLDPGQQPLRPRGAQQAGTGLTCRRIKGLRTAVRRFGGSAGGLVSIPSMEVEWSTSQSRRFRSPWKLNFPVLLGETQPGPSSCRRSLSPGFGAIRLTSTRLRVSGTLAAASDMANRAQLFDRKPDQACTPEGHLPCRPARGPKTAQRFPVPAACEEGVLPISREIHIRDAESVVESRKTFQTDTDGILSHG